MRMRWAITGLFVFLAAALVANNSRAEEPKFDLAAIGGFAVSGDNSTLVVSLTTKTELIFFDTVAGKELKRVKVEFQPTQLAWDGKVLFAGQKSSAIVHILDADSGKEMTTAKAGAPVRNFAIVKGVCFVSDDNRGVYAIDAKGTSTKTAAGGTFVAADPKGGFVYTVIDGRARTDIFKHSVDGTTLKQVAQLPGAVGASLPNVKGVQVSNDGKLVGVIAGGGWTSTDRKRHYGVPFYDTEDMKTMTGDIETGPFPSGCAFHPVLPLVIATEGGKGNVCSTKSLAPGQKIENKGGSGALTVLAFVGKGKKLAWANSDGGKDMSMLKFYDVEITKEQQAELDKAYSGK